MSLMIVPSIHFLYSERLNSNSEEVFFKKSPDLIAVFTGDKGRISKALEIARNYPHAKLLISGVYSKNNLKILLKHNHQEGLESKNFDFFSRVIELDFRSQNTYQNVLQTLKIILENPSLRDVLILSSDYHLPRIKFLLWKENKNQSTKFYFWGIKTQKIQRWLYQVFFENIKLLRSVTL